MNIHKPNKLGWVTGLTINNPYQSVMEFNLNGVASAENAMGLYNTLRGWMDDGIGASYQKEWKCLYCTSPNSINETHCLKCGAPRNFILG